jgi:uncharacterized membrane protein
MLNVKTITKLAFVASIYVVTTVWNPFSYDAIQFRISEILILLCFYRKEYVYALTLGCFIANIFSPLGVYDMIFGTLATVLSCFFIVRCKNLFVASLIPVIFNAIIVGLELHYLIKLDLVASMVSVALGEFAVVSIFGVLVFQRLSRNVNFMKLIEANQNCEKDICE